MTSAAKKACLSQMTHNCTIVILNLLYFLCRNQSCIRGLKFEGRYIDKLVIPLEKDVKMKIMWEYINKVIVQCFYSLCNFPKKQTRTNNLINPSKSGWARVYFKILSKKTLFEMWLGMWLIVTWPTLFCTCSVHVQVPGSPGQGCRPQGGTRGVGQAPLPGPRG